MDIEQPQNEILEQRKADLGDGFEQGFRVGFENAVVTIHDELLLLYEAYPDETDEKGEILESPISLALNIIKVEREMYLAFEKHTPGLTLAREAFLAQEGLLEKS